MENVDATMKRCFDAIEESVMVEPLALTVEALIRLQPLNPFVPLVMSVQETKRSE